MARKTTTRGKQKEKRQVAHGRAYIHSTFNNTIVTITDDSGNTLAWASAGHVGFKGSRKGTPFAAQLSAESCAKKAKDHAMGSIDVYVSGPGGGRETAIRSLNASRPRSQIHPRHYAIAPQRLPPTQKATSLKFF